MAGAKLLRAPCCTTERAGERGRREGRGRERKGRGVLLKVVAGDVHWRWLGREGEAKAPRT